MKKRIISLFLCLTLWTMVVGCSKAEVIKAIDEIEAKLPQIAQIATGVLFFVAPQFAPMVGPIFGIIAADGKLLEKLIQDYKVSQNASLLDKINALYDDIEKNLQDINNVVGIKNLQLMTRVQAAISFIGLILSDLANFVHTHASHSLTAALPSIAAAPDEKSGLSARDIAVEWNKICGDENAAKIPVPRAHVAGAPVPFTGRQQ